MNIAYIGLGSNLDNPEHQIRQALIHIKQSNNINISKLSSLYFSRPMGPQDQPDYMNAVIEITTTLSAIELLDQLQHIENNAGRVRKENRWGARVLDLDILLFNNATIDNERLTIPHYGLTQREFVLIPLAEITDNLLLPSGANISTLAKNITTNGLKIHSQLN